MTLVLVLSLSSCGEKAGSQEVSVGYGKSTSQISQISKQFSEVSPPGVIQELNSTLEAYQPQVTIITPQPEEVFQDSKITVRFEVRDLPIFKNLQWELGPHLQVILDNEPYISVYDLNQPLILQDLLPGTHTLRVFASRPWGESFKNEGAYAQTTFHIFTKTDDNNPDPRLPLLTYSIPQDNYGAEPILLDFYLTNAPLHLVAKENANDEISDWRIRCTINDESFVFDRWQAVYLKGFHSGTNWVKLEFLDNQGNPLKNSFNTTVRLINYQPKGKDTLSRIIRGELTSDEVRGIVDANYTVKQPATQTTPSPTPSATPQVEKTPETLPQEEKPIPKTKIPETLEAPPPVLPSPSASPTLEPITPLPEITPTPQATEVPAEKVAPTPEKEKFGGYFQRRPRPIPQATPNVSPTLEPITPLPEITPESQPEITPTPQATEVPEKVVPTPARRKFSDYFQRRSRPIPQVTPSESPTVEPIVPTRNNARS